MPNFVDIGASTRVDASPPDPENPPTYSDDAYPAIVEDQRHAYGCVDADEILAFQRAWHHGEVPPHPLPPAGWPVKEITADPQGREVVPHINASRWIAICPECGAGNAVWDKTSTMVCLGRGCALMFKVAWQHPKERAEVIRLLADWPEMNRSWDAHKGETVEELKIQKVLLQGVAPEKRNGLLVAAGVTMPDDLTSPQEYLDRMKAQRVKRERGLL